MVRLFKRIWLIPLLVLLVINAIPKVSAVEPYAKIYPEKGDVFTDIYVQIRNLGDDILFNLYSWWDDKLIIENLQNPDFSSVYWAHEYKGYYDIHISAPDEYPYTELGNHTIFIEIWRDRTVFFINFTLTFEIIEYYPPTSDWWKWWESVPDEIKANLTGAQGLQGIQGIQGEQGIQGIQGVKGDKGDKGDTGPYPLEAVQLNLSLSAVSVVTFIIAATMLYKTKKLAHST